MSKKKTYEIEKDFHHCWYALSANRLLMTLGPLKDEINCDVCVVGAGFTGISAALELSEKGLDVVLLEAGSIADGASGRNGGQLIRGFGMSPDELTSKYGIDDAKTLCNLTLEGLALVLERINKHEIECDLKFGHVTAALRKRHIHDLKEERDAWAKIGHKDMEYIDKERTQEMVCGNGYIGGLLDPKGAHFHPVNYALGVLQAAQKAGCKVHDQSRVTSIIPGEKPKVITENGSVTANYIVLAGAVRTKGTKPLTKKTLIATQHILATEPLNESQVEQLIPADVAVSEANFIMNYFRLSQDNRLIFGGDCRYRNVHDPKAVKALRKRMLKVFPSMATIKIDHCWRGPVEMTFNRLPHIGRLTPEIFFAHGFSGHGLIATNIAGKVIAEALTGTAARFDVFARIKHMSLGFRRPIFHLAALWYNLRDLL